VTHNRKPDALPMEGASIAEALEALKHLHPYGGTKEAAKCCDEAYRTVRSALERAAAEGEALADAWDQGWGANETSSGDLAEWARQRIERNPYRKGSTP
jgi:hypothetical protein